MSVEVKKPWATPALSSVDMRDTAQETQKGRATNENFCDRAAAQTGNCS